MRLTILLLIAGSSMAQEHSLRSQIAGDSANIDRDLFSVAGISIPSIPPGEICKAATSKLASNAVLKDSQCVCSQNNNLFDVNCTKGPVCIKPINGSEFSGMYVFDTVLNATGVTSNSSVTQILSALATAVPQTNSCFKYSSLYNGANVCIDQTASGCTMSIDGTACTSCSLCDVTNFYYSFDCSNVMKGATMNQCSGNGTSLDGTILQFKAANNTDGTTCVLPKPLTNSGSALIGQGMARLTLAVVSVSSLIYIL